MRWQLDILDDIIDTLDKIIEIVLAIEHSCYIINVLLSSHCKDLVASYFIEIKLKTLGFGFKDCKLLEYFIK